MSIPFLKNRAKDAGLITQICAPDEKPEQEHEEDHGLMSAASDILDAIETKDHKKLASAIRATFQICDSEPHEEGPHLEEETE